MAIVVEKPCPLCGQSIDSTENSCRHCGERFRPLTEEDPQRASHERFQAHQAEGLYSIALIGVLTLLCVPICYYVPILRTMWGYAMMTTVIGAPISAVYGTVFLFYYREPFALRWKAETGTVLNCLLSLLILAGFVWGISTNW